MAQNFANLPKPPRSSGRVDTELLLAGRGPLVHAPFACFCVDPNRCIVNYGTFESSSRILARVPSRAIGWPETEHPCADAS